MRLAMMFEGSLMVTLKVKKQWLRYAESFRSQQEESKYDDEERAGYWRMEMMFEG